jgi:hypothetical protein
MTVALEDDLHGGPADETVRLGYDGTDYETDLTEKNARAFRQQLAPFAGHAARLAVGRHPGLRGPRQAGSAVATSGHWAKDHGIAVSTRGRIPASVMEKYQAAAKGG